MTAFIGLIGVGFFFLAYDAVDKSGARMALFGAVAVGCFAVSIFGMPKNVGSGCFMDWDARSNSEICD